MKHAYSSMCECLRCRREHGRRNRQAAASHSRRYVLQAQQTRRRAECQLDRWARAYYDTEGGIDQFNPDDR